MIHCLLDANVLIALAWPQHIHHAQSHDWFGRVGHRAWATCPLTQVAFVRISSNPKIIPDAVAPRDALAALKTIVQLPGHKFWPDQIALTDHLDFSNLTLTGHRQVTDAYLLALARYNRGRLVTFDGGIGHLLRDAKDRSRYVHVIEA